MCVCHVTIFIKNCSFNLDTGIDTGFSFQRQKIDLVFEGRIKNR